MRKTLACLLFSSCLCADSGLLAGDAKLWLYAGTYTAQDGKGIYLFEFDQASGELTPKGLAAEAANPSFLEISPAAEFLYAVEESKSEAGKNGALAAFKISKDNGRLSLLNRLGGIGSGPCHLALDNKSARVMTAAYGDGTISSVQLKNDGSLESVVCRVKGEGAGADPKRQAGPHAHFAIFAPDGKNLLICDLGLDKILNYAYDENTGKLTPAEKPWTQTAPGSGPRHMAFHPSGKFAYLVNELKPSVTAYAYENGALKELQTLPLLEEGASGKGCSGAEIQIHPSGRFLYSSIRGDDAIAAFKIADDGTLAFSSRSSSGGKTPRSFEIAPDGRHLIAANQSSGNIAVFKIDPSDGSLAKASEQPLPSPVCVKFATQK